MTKLLLLMAFTLSSSIGGAQTRVPPSQATVGRNPEIVAFNIFSKCYNPDSTTNKNDYAKVKTCLQESKKLGSEITNILSDICGAQKPLCYWRGLDFADKFNLREPLSEKDRDGLIVGVCSTEKKRSEVQNCYEAAAKYSPVNLICYSGHTLGGQFYVFRKLGRYDAKVSRRWPLGDIQRVYLPKVNPIINFQDFCNRTDTNRSKPDYEAGFLFSLYKDEWDDIQHRIYDNNSDSQQSDHRVAVSTPRSAR